MSDSMIEISLCMIVRDEEKSLGRCLSSVGDIADEIIIIDTGSTDGTKEIARSFGAKLYDFAWVNDFAAARNYSFRKAGKDYIVWLDADDILLPEDREQFMQLKRILPAGIDSVAMKYNVGFDGEGRAVTSLRRNRLVKRSCNFEWIGAVHEYLDIPANILLSDIAVTHMKDKEPTDRNLKIYRARVEQGEQLPVRDLYYFANELKNNHYFEEAILYYAAYLASGLGWVEDNIRACIKQSECYYHLGNLEEAVRAIGQSLVYDKPGPEFCYRLGCYLCGLKAVGQAVYWFELALQVPMNNSDLGIVNQMFHTWLPHYQLALCYDYLGDTHKANYHHEQVLQYNQQTAM